MRLPSTKDADVYGIHSGLHTPELNYFADVICDIGSLKEFELRVCTIEYSEKSLKSDGTSSVELGCIPAVTRPKSQ